MTLFRLTAYALFATFFPSTGIVPTYKEQTPKPPITIVTDPSWDVSGQKTHFGEYPLSAEQTASATSPLYGGTYKAVVADHNGRGKIIPGSMPIWRSFKADRKGEAYQFRKTVPLGADPVRKITLEVNCDDVARIYINQRLVSVEKRDGKLKDGNDDWFLFRSVSGFMFDRIYTYDVTDYFFTNVTNTILAEAMSMTFAGSHAYFSTKIVIEFDAPQPPVLAIVKKKAVTKRPSSAEATAGKAGKSTKIVFEADRDPEIDKLDVGSILELGHVFFKVNDYQLDSASYRTLTALATFLNRHPSLKIEIGGHTNLRPNDQFAAELSANRARTVMRFLTDKGVAVDRVTYNGYGKSQPRVNAISKEADRANQRVEVKILEK
ncbi:MAG: OmpA family protein [Saprospiraceae bacterium]|nr:OmpA family protein [Saprospiraceae bacterium]